MGKFWSLLFLLVPILGVATFVAGPIYDIWLPKDVSTHGRTIDHLYYFILCLTGVVFIATEIALFWFMWRYDGKSPKKRAGEVHPRQPYAWKSSGRSCPPRTLLFIAIYQMNAWADSKIRTPKMTPTVEVTARQFEWRLRYPGPRRRCSTRRTIFTWSMICTCRSTKMILVRSEEHGRAAQFFSAQFARQARRRAGHDDSGLVRATEPACTTWSARSYAAGATTR